ncbi:MAG: sensor histidine kinase [Bacteroidales bacterium]|nr:sensor histidine kinase [Bacteroidales bacterium]
MNGNKHITVSQNDPKDRSIMLICTSLYVVFHVISICLKETSIERNDWLFFSLFLVKDVLSVCGVFYVLPRLLRKNSYKRLRFALLMVAAILVNVCLSLLINQLLFSELVIARFYAMELSVLFLIIVGCIRNLTLKIAEQYQQQLALEEEKRNLELYYLGLQLNPHFLFNTLNVIYVQARKEKAATVSDMVLQLSDLLRYQLYESADKLVLIKSELKYIENYIDLQRMRKVDIDIDFQKIGNFEGIMVYPFLCISFLENAFKYVDENIAGEKLVNIIMRVDERGIYFGTKNSIGPERKNASDKKSSGIGIENTKKRLELLYPVRYTLDINESEKYFNVELLINVEK